MHLSLLADNDYSRSARGEKHSEQRTMDPVYVGLCVYIVDIKLPMGESLLLAGLKEKVHTGERGLQTLFVR